MINVHLYYSKDKNIRGFREALAVNKFFKKIILIDAGNKNNFYNKKINEINIKANNIFIWYIKTFIFLRSIKNIKIINFHNAITLPLSFFYKNKSKLIYDPHELESETSKKNFITKYIVRIIEFTFIRYIDHIITVSESIAKWYEHYYNIKKPSVVLNFPKKKLFLKKKNFFRKKFNLEKNIKIFLYQGILTEEGRGINFLIDIFSKYKPRNSVIVFMGDGPYSNRIKNYSKRFENIFYHQLIKEKFLPQYTASADYGVHMMENTCLNHEYALPNKFFEYLNSGLPVIVSNLVEMSKFVKKYNCGYVVAFNEKKFLNQIEVLEIKKLKKFKVYLKKVHCENNWEIQSKKIINIYKNLLK